MKKLFLLSCCFIASVYCRKLYTNVYPKLPEIGVKGDPGQPLFLTPLLDQGRSKEARQKSRVFLQEMPRVKSYSGYLTVDERFNSNLFFWFFPSETNYKNDPVVLWLQGGPGGTSLFGLFAENGPFLVHNGYLVRRKYSWTYGHSVLYIDNPVGTGFSFTNADGLCRNETIIGNALYNALTQFYQLFPELRSNEFFATGESYGGKYVPAVSYAILKNNPTAKHKINLKGLAMGDGFSDPIHQSNYAEYMYLLGLIDVHGKKAIWDLEQKGINYMKRGEWLKAANVFNNLLNDGGLFANLSGIVDYYDYITVTPPTYGYFGNWVQKADVRRAIHVGNTSFGGQSNAVGDALMVDLMQSVAPWISELLSHYRVLTYNGQVDIIVAYPLTLNFLQHLNFSSAAEYKTAKRYKWYVGSELAGYSKTAGNLTEVLVRDAGHMVPSNQPKWAFDMITRFTRNKSFH